MFRWRRKYMHFTDINGIKYRINIYESFLHHRLPNGSNGQSCYYNPPRLSQGNTPYNCAYIETSSNRIVFQHRIDLIKENFLFLFRVCHICRISWDKALSFEWTAWFHHVLIRVYANHYSSLYIIPSFLLCCIHFSLSLLFTVMT